MVSEDDLEGLMPVRSHSVQDAAVQVSHREKGGLEIRDALVDLQ